MALLKGSCHCGGVKFSVVSHTPSPYQSCYCSICRKTNGGAAGAAINLGADAATLKVEGKTKIYHAIMRDGKGGEKISNAERHFCGECGSHLWLYDSTWPELVHPLSTAMDTPLKPPPRGVRLMLAFKPGWMPEEYPLPSAQSDSFDEYPYQSIEEWHKKHSLW
eukprot:CAMPEP_0206149726 /NCGR_PEP_ID=MMETSP1473-20131121/37934_1 /ASSEMBLY_ACC=CAM_ASM_001109 /TAXON_ID=1461547 /ORGANISM="Stichococcus sp, Strain RCC1054" /LENGTH=163 /DNA_ID=CAMNT_0053547207 /DNA_START=927 /DNA_END=1415 /DNA_ORIENTATION=-